MEIQFERRGGFMGLRLSANLHLDQLSQADAQALLEELEQADFFALPEQLNAPANGMDRFHYRVSVQTEEKAHVVECSETAAPDSLRPLLERLTQLARLGPQLSPRDPI